MSKITSSAELFWKFQPKFKEIVWHANEIQGESLLLAPGYLGREYPIPPMIKKDPEGATHLWWSSRGVDGEDLRPAFNLREGNLACVLAFDPSKEEAIGLQLEKTVMQAIHDGPFKRRRFFMRPGGGWSKVSDYRFCRHFIIPIEFRTDGRGPIPGLRLGEAIAYDWRFFIPDGPERAAIQAAVNLECMQATHSAVRG